MIDAFISYSRVDELYLNKLKICLGPLIKGNFIRPWDDSLIIAGEDFDRKIKERLEKALLFILLVSPEFLNSSYINSVELTSAIDKQSRNEALIIPIILRPCYWEITDLKSLNVLPQNGSAITERDNIDSAFLEVAKGIYEAIQRLPEKIKLKPFNTEKIKKQLLENKNGGIIEALRYQIDITIGVSFSYSYYSNLNK